jgi:hypothetical protein
MNFTDLSALDLGGVLLGFVFTLFIFSYILGDNPLFKFAIHVFIGVAAGYASVVTLFNVILPQLIFPFLSGNQGEIILAVIFLIPSLMLLAKIVPRLSALGNPAVAILVGIGAAVAIGGAVTGTIFPQTSASINAFGDQSIINAIVLSVSTLTTLIYFQFSLGQKKGTPKFLQRIFQGIGWVGQFFVAVTFGALFTGVYIAVMTALIERFDFLWTFVRDILLSSNLLDNSL